MTDGDDDDDGGGGGGGGGGELSPNTTGLYYILRSDNILVPDTVILRQFLPKNDDEQYTRALDSALRK